MKYEDFWSIYFTIWRILLIFYLTHSYIYLFNYHHLYYLSETASFLPMFLLLILNYCCSDGIIVEASDGFGYRVWFLVYRVWCFHPSSWTGSLPASFQCQHPARLFYPHLGFFPVGCCSSCWFSPGIGLLSWYPVDRSPSLVDHCDRDSYRDSVSRILDGGFSRIISASRRIWNLMMVDVASLVICRCWYYPDFPR